MPLTVPQIIEIAEVSQYLALKDVAKGNKFAQNVSPKLPGLLYGIRKTVSFGYTQNILEVIPSANFLYALCAPYSAEAQQIISGGGGGSVVPVTPTGGIPSPLDFIISASSLIPTGASTVNLPDFVGFNLNFSRGGITQYTTNPGDGSSYYSWNSSTGDFTCFGVAQVGEQFRLYV